MATGILLTLTIYSVIGMLLAWTIKIEDEWEREQLKILILIILLLVLFGMATTDGIGKGDVDDNGL